MPARPLHLAWRRVGQPPVEWFLGPVDVVHGTNFVVPPTRGGGRGDRPRPHHGALSRAVRPIHPRLPRAHPPGPAAGRLGPHAVGLRGRRGDRRLRGGPRAGPGRPLGRAAPRRKPTVGGGPAVAGARRPPATCWPSARPSPARTFPDWSGPSARWPPTGRTSPWCWPGPRGGASDGAPGGHRRLAGRRPGAAPRVGGRSRASAVCSEARLALAYPSVLRGLRLPAAPGHGGRGAGRGDPGRGPARGAGRRRRAGGGRGRRSALAGALARVLDGRGVWAGADREGACPGGRLHLGPLRRGARPPLPRRRPPVDGEPVGPGRVRAVRVLLVVEQLRRAGARRHRHATPAACSGTGRGVSPATRTTGPRRARRLRRRPGGDPVRQPAAGRRGRRRPAGRLGPARADLAAARPAPHPGLGPRPGRPPPGASTSSTPSPWRRPLSRWQETGDDRPGGHRARPGLADPSRDHHGAGPAVARGGAGSGRCRRPTPSSSPRRRWPRRLVEAGVARDRVTVMPRGSDHLPPPDRAGAAGVLARHGVGGPYLLTVSTLEPRKNLARLLGGLRRGAGRVPRTLAAGGGGPPGWGTWRPVGRPTGDGVIVGPVPAPEVLAGLYAGARALRLRPAHRGLRPAAARGHGFGVPVVVSTAVPSVAPRPPAAACQPLWSTPLGRDCDRRGPASRWPATRPSGAASAEPGRPWSPGGPGGPAAMEHVELWRSL